MLGTETENSSDTGLLKAWEWYGVPSSVHRKKGREHSEESPTSITCMTERLYTVLGERILGEKDNVASGTS